MTLQQFFQYICSSFHSIYIFFGCPSLGVRPLWSRRGKRKKLRSRLCGRSEAEARWLRCPLARESYRGLNSSTAEQSAAKAGGSRFESGLRLFFPFSLMTLQQFFQYISSSFHSIYIFFDCPSLGVRPWWSRRGSGKSQGRVCVADLKLKRDG